MDFINIVHAHVVTMTCNVQGGAKIHLSETALEGNIISLCQVLKQTASYRSYAH